jgi:hypothetical protein
MDLRRLKGSEKQAFGAVAKWLGNGLQNRHTWVQIPSAPLKALKTGVPPLVTTVSATADDGKVSA